jgi:hypothetical protein
MNIELDQLLDIALKGVRRAAAFLALGVNSARDPKLVNYMLPGDVLLQFFPQSLGQEDIAHLKTEYEKWVILAGLRELIETFAVYLDGIHWMGLTIAVNKGDMSSEQAGDFGRTFERKGIEYKLKKLKNRFQIESDKGKYLISINKARNCLAHRRGVVAPLDTNPDGILKVMWWAADIFAATPEGKEISLMPPLTDGGLLLEQGGDIKLRFVDRDREFHLGQALELTPRDLSEICFLVNFAAREIMGSTMQHARTQGVQITERKMTEQPHAGDSENRAEGAASGVPDA